MTEPQTSHSEKKTKRKKTLKRIYDLLSGLIVLALLAACVFLVYKRVTGQSIDWFGYRLFEVQSGSMEPTIMTKDNILTKNVKDKSILNEGDIVVFQNDRIWDALGKPQMHGSFIVHRILNIYVDELDGKTYIVTKGDNNTREDLPTEIEQVVALYVDTVDSPFVLFMMSPWGIVAAVCALVAFVCILRIGYRLLLMWRKKESAGVDGDDPEDGNAPDVDEERTNSDDKAAVAETAQKRWFIGKKSQDNQENSTAKGEDTTSDDKGVVGGAVHKRWFVGKASKGDKAPEVDEDRTDK